MLHGLLWLGLNQQLPLEAYFVLVVHSHLEEGAHVVQLLLQVSVEEGLVAFTPTPEHWEMERGEERRGKRGNKRRRVESRGRESEQSKNPLANRVEIQSGPTQLYHTKLYPG